MAAAALAAVVVAGLLVNAALTRRTTEPAAAGPDTIALDGLPDLSVSARGPRDAPAVALLHAYTLSSVDWQRVVRRLSSRYRLLAVDLLGHGRSEKPRDGYAVPDQARAVWAALDRLRVRCPVLAGHSFGGTVATAMAEERPKAAAALVAVGSASRWSDIDFPLTARASRWPIVGELVFQTMSDGMVEDALADAFRPDTAVPDSFVDAFRAMTYSAYRETAVELREFLEDAPVERRLADTPMPVRAIAGSEDAVVTPEALRHWAEIPTARTRAIEGGSHMLPWEEAREIAEIVASVRARASCG